MKKLILSLLMLPVVVMVSCSSDDDVTVSQINRPLNVVIETTRAEATTTNTLSSFKMYAVNPSHEYTLTKESGNWIPSPLTWPPSADDDDNVTFYAVDGGTYNKEGQFVSLELNEDAFQQKDLLVAKTVTSYAASNGTLHLNFKHVCAAVNFVVYASNTLLNSLSGSTLYITEMKLTGVKNSGHYNIAANEWTDVDGSGSYTLTTAPIAVGAKADAVELPCKYVFMIPQVLGDDAKLEFKYKVGDNAEKVNSISLAGKEWSISQQDKIEIKLGTGLININ